MSDDRLCNDTPSAPSRVVGIGAAAGDLEALKQLLSALPADSGMAFVVVQPLPPDAKSVMPGGLQRHTAMPLLAVDGDHELHADTVYLLAAGCRAELQDGRLVVRPGNPASARQPRPIDDWFTALAALGERAAAVLLAGTGADGWAGAHALRAAGGLVIVQAPAAGLQQAAPGTAAEADLADLVALPADVGPALQRWLSDPRTVRRVTGEEAAANASGDGPGAPVLQALQDATGLDFGAYRSRTLLHRMGRHLAAPGLPAAPGALAQRLRAEPALADRLFAGLWHGAAALLRDAPALEALRRQVVEPLVDALPEGGALRLWCCGCATGEEAYALAMLACEAFARRGREPAVRVLATDVHAASVQRAAAGDYDDDALAGVPEDLRRRHYVAQGEGRSRVAEPLRRLVVFSVQNVLRDPGFQRIDLLVCRNLLHDLRPSAQARVLSRFQQALNADGLLLLGDADLAGEAPPGFMPAGEHRHLFRKRPDPQPRLAPPPTPGPAAHRRAGTRPDARAALRLHETLAQRFAPPGLLVDAKDELVHVYGDAGRHLRAAPGRFGGNVFQLLDGPLRTAVTVLLRRAAQGAAPAAMSGVVPEPGQPERRLQVEVERIDEPALPQPYYLVRLLPQGDAVAGACPAPGLAFEGDTQARVVTELQAELVRTREALQRSVEDLEAANEELQAGNEDLGAANEELLSSNRALHALNEELHAVNAEHEKKIRELRDTTTDLNNLIRASEMPLIFLDMEARLRMYTPPATTLFPLRPVDIGRELRELVPCESDPTLFDDLAAALAGTGPRDRALNLRDGRNLRRRVAPYRTDEGAVGGLVITYTDATQQVRWREQQLDLQHQSQLKAIVESVPHLMWTCTAAGDCDFLNPQWLQYTGVPASAQMGSGWLHQVHADDRAALVAAWDESVRSGRPFRLRFRIRRHDGVYRWFDTQGVPQLDAQGRVVKWFGSNTDVHEVVELEHALGERDRFIQTVADNINAMVGYWDREQVNRFANRHYLEWFGRPAEQVRGHTLREVLGEEVYARNRPYVEAALRGEAQQFERSIVRPDGSVGHLLAEYQPHVVDGTVRGFIATATDISRVQEARLLADQVLEVSPEAKLVIAADGTLVKWNPAAERLLGHPAADLGRMKVDQLLPPELRSHHQRMRQMFLASPTRRPMGKGRPLPLLRGDGTTVDVEIDLSGVTYDGRPAAIACVREVSLSPDALRRLDLAIQSRNTFLAQMSHEIRTPLNAILGMAQLLEQDRPSPAQLDRLRRIEEASSHLLGIVNDVLDFSKAEAGGLQLDHERFELHGLLDRSIAMVAEKARLKRLALAAELAADVPEALVGDGRRIEQILVNLLSNAVKFTHHGRIDVKVSAAPAAGQRVMLRMEVADTGIGIAAGDLADLFTPFRQVQQGHARRYGGTGLGLSICRQLARAMDGECGVHSVPGAGSTFWFTVLVERPEAGRPGDPAESAPMPLDGAGPGMFAGRCVLVVEDNEVNRLVLHDLLAACTDMEVTEAEDGLAALEIARQRVFDLVLMDVQMPGLDGLETTRRMRGLPGYAQVPIFALTANVQANEVNECLAAGMDGHFGKPIMIDDVLRRLGEIWHQAVPQVAPAGG